MKSAIGFFIATLVLLSCIGYLLLLPHIKFLLRKLQIAFAIAGGSRRGSWAESSATYFSRQPLSPKDVVSRAAT